MRECAQYFNDDENHEFMPYHFEIKRITDGLAFGEGSISGVDEDLEVLAQTDETIHGHRGILVPVDRENGKSLDDDGCGDGRGVKTIFRSRERLNKSLNRAKVFGGSVVMTAASIIGTGESQGRSLNEVFAESIDWLEDRDMDFGAHTDEHAEGKNCGCGAIDKAPEAIVAAIKYEQPIRGVLVSLGVGEKPVDAVYENLRDYVGAMPYHEAYSGRKVIDGIIDAGKVVKELAGQHREKRIIFNNVRGHTVNQSLVREATDGRVQAFAVDLWRIDDIAEKLFAGQPERQDQAYASQLIYTLAISAVLTKGDLPVDMIDESAAPVTA